MAETLIPPDNPEHEDTPEPAMPAVLGSAAIEGARIHAASRNLFAVDFVRFNEEYLENIPPEQHQAELPYAAHAFVLQAFHKMPPPYRRKWHIDVPGKQVDAYIAYAQNKLEIGPSRNHSRDAVHQRKFQDHLNNMIKYASGNLRNNRFPETLGARRLIEQLHNSGSEDLVRPVRLVLAAYGAVILSLPDSKRNLPPEYYDYTARRSLWYGV